MRVILKCPTRIGVLCIAQSSDRRFQPILGSESLGSYRSIAHAIDDLANDTTSALLHPETFGLLYTSTLKLPDNPGEWVLA